MVARLETISTVKYLPKSSSAPTLTSEDTSGIEQSDAVLHRKARMTPLWRNLASKPHGAYCHDHIECLTRLCRNGFCSFDEPVHS
ncbi:liver-expressed antimicrobial peptide 2-like [Neoarius graeffei]|uniref:liver-expressed antimicrobial peptide 2-like n=1 Tax=Neoarius graeffei TaxID=443677 RepID=UPI00298D5EEB|nr:liver-expressed antimicrobial peptide 2-like [Neoarius graeffei]